MLGIAIPHFVLGLMLLYVVSFRLGWLPVGGNVPLTDNPIEGVKYLLLPALVLGLTGGAVLARFVRTSIAEVMDQDYVRTARAKGLRARTVVMQHALRNGLIPVVTVMALQFATLLTGSVVVENVFSRPGVGRLVVGAVQARDYPVVQGSLLFLVVGFILVNLAADLMYGFLDPRIRVN
jgi:peptide/nickel transport system permease protein